ALVERDVVDAEPQDADDHQARQVGARGQRGALGEGQDAERGGADQQPRQAQRAGRQVAAGGADPDERRGPADDGGQRRREDERRRAGGGGGLRGRGGGHALGDARGG